MSQGSSNPPFPPRSYPSASLPDTEAGGGARPPARPTAPPGLEPVNLFARETSNQARPKKKELSI